MPSRVATGVASSIAGPLGLALGIALVSPAAAQPAGQGPQTLPEVTVNAPKPNRAVRRASRQTPVVAQRRPVRIAGPAAPRRAPAVAVPGPAAVAAPSGPGDGIERAGGPVNGYLANRSATGTKTDTPLLETPQAISIITQDEIRARQAQNLNEALRYVPGVTSEVYGTTTAFDIIKIRGFQAQTYLDGLRLPFDPGSQFAIPRVEPYGLERIEVLKGPSSGLYGQTDPGGLLELVTKKPKVVPHYEVLGQTGSFNRAQGAFDIGGPLDPGGQYLYRIVGLGRKANGQVDYTQDNKIYIAPSFTWRPDANTSLTLLANYQSIDNKGYQQYLPGVGSLLPSSIGRIPLNRYIGEPALDNYHLHQGSIGYEFEHRFNPWLKIESKARYFGVSNDLTGARADAIFPDDRTVFRTENFVKSSSRNIAIDNHAQADFATGPFVHKVLAGLDFQDTHSDSNYRTTPISTLDLFMPVYNPAAVPSPALLSDFIKVNTRQSQFGLYLQDQIKFGGFMLTLTGRHDWARTDNLSWAVYPPFGYYRSRDEANTGRVGLSYLFDAGLSVYANYSTSFNPVSGADRNGSPFRPTTGEGMEAGAKFQPPGMNLLISAAYYSITQKNVLTADPTNVLFSVQTGKVRSRGFEFEVRGNITPELEVAGGYALTDPRIVSDTTITNIGNIVPNVALETASLWGKYTFLDGPVSGLGLGFGARYIGRTFVAASNTVRTRPYTLFDAALSYDFGKLRPDLKGLKLQVNATNLTNKYYIPSCLTSTVYCGIGQSRTILGTLSYAWN